jgi:hypothetical protein
MRPCHKTVRAHPAHGASRMKLLSTLAAIALAALALCGATASAQTASAAPPAIAHRGPITGKPDALFNQIETGFSNRRFGPYTVASSDAASRTLVIRRSNIDSANWARWAYCRMGPLDLLDILRDGSVTMNIHLEPTTRWITWAVVRAEFTGTYELGSMVKETQCISTGVLEEDILHRIGASGP